MIKFNLNLFLYDTDPKACQIFCGEKKEKSLRKEKLSIIFNHVPLVERKRERKIRKEIECGINKSIVFSYCCVYYVFDAVWANTVGFVYD